MTNACKYELGKTRSAHYVIHTCTVHTSAVTSLVLCELEKVQNYNVVKNFGNIATSSFTNGDLVQKWGKSL